MTATILDLHHLERLLQSLDTQGWETTEVFDQGAWQSCTSAQLVLRRIAECDPPVIKLQSADGGVAIVRLAWGLGPALLVDNYTGPEVFREAIDAAIAELSALASADLLERLLAQVVQSGAQNYQGSQFDIDIGSEELQAVVLLQLRNRPTPHQLRMLAEQERNELRAELDALLGVVRAVHEQLRRFEEDLPTGFDRRVLKLVEDAAAPGQQQPDLPTPEMVH